MSQVLWKLLCATLLAASGCQSAEAEPAEPAAPVQKAVLVDQAAPVEPPAVDMGAAAVAGELPAEPWPMEPLAIGLSPNFAKHVAIGLPRSSSMTRRASSVSNGGTSSCSPRSSTRM